MADLGLNRKTITTILKQASDNMTLCLQKMGSEYKWSFKDFKTLWGTENSLIFNQCLNAF